MSVADPLKGKVVIEMKLANWLGLLYDINYSRRDEV